MELRRIRGAPAPGTGAQLKDEMAMDGRRARIVLGLGNDAGPVEIRRAFRARALVTHPDHGGDASSFAEIAVARPGSRPRFDSYDAPRRPAPTRTFADVVQVATARLG